MLVSFIRCCYVNAFLREDVEVLPYKSKGSDVVSFVGEGLRALPKSQGVNQIAQGSVPCVKSFVF